MVKIILAILLISALSYQSQAFLLGYGCNTIVCRLSELEARVNELQRQVQALRPNQGGIPMGPNNPNNPNNPNIPNNFAPNGNQNLPGQNNGPSNNLRQGYNSQFVPDELTYQNHNLYNRNVQG